MTQVGRQWHDIEVIQRIVFSFLVARDLVRLSVLNKSFYRSAMHSKCLDLSDDELAHDDVYVKLVPYYRHARTLRLRRAFCISQELDHLMQLHRLHEVTLVDVVSLNDFHLSTLTSQARFMTFLQIEGCHGIMEPRLALSNMLTMIFDHNIMLRNIIYTNAPVLTYLQVTGCPSFNSFDLLLHAMPALQIATFSDSNALIQFRCDLPHLHSLFLDQCAHLSSLELHLPALRILNVQLCGQLQQVVVCAATLQVVSFSMLPSMQVLFLDCPRLKHLNLTGCAQLQPSGLTIECPKLLPNRIQCAGTSLGSVFAHQD